MNRFKRGTMRTCAVCLITTTLLMGFTKIYPATAMELLDVPIIGDIIKLITNSKSMERAVENGYMTKMDEIKEDKIGIEYVMRDSKSIVLVIDIPEYRELIKKEELWIKDFRLESKSGNIAYTSSWATVEKGGVIKIGDANNLMGIGDSSSAIDDFNDIIGTYYIYGKLCKRKPNEEKDKYLIEKELMALEGIGVDFDMIKKSPKHTKYLNEKLLFEDDEISLLRVEVDAFQMIVEFEYNNWGINGSKPNSIEIVVEDEKGNSWDQKNGSGTYASIHGNGSKITRWLDSPIFKECNEVYLKEVMIGFIYHPKEMTIDLKEGSINKSMREHFTLEKFEDEGEKYVLEFVPKGNVHFDIGEIRREVLEYDETVKYESIIYRKFKEEDHKISYLQDEWNEKEGCSTIKAYEKLRIEVAKEAFDDMKDKKLRIHVYPPVKNFTVKTDIKIWQREEK